MRQITAPPELVDLILVTRDELASMEERLGKQFPGAAVMGAILVHKRAAVFCTEGHPTHSELRALLMAAKAMAAYLGVEVDFDVQDLKEEKPRGEA